MTPSPCFARVSPVPPSRDPDDIDDEGSICTSTSGISAPTSQVSVVGQSINSLHSLRRREVVTKFCDEEKLHDLLVSETRSWPSRYHEASQVAVLEALGLVREASGGALLIVAPMQQLQRLSLQSTDSGYLTGKLQGLHIASLEFRQTFLEFTRHSENDRWPSNHEAKGLPKDGAVLLTPNGLSAKAAVKLIGLPTAPYQWSSRGTRHEAALATAAFLSHSVIFIRSDSGDVHCLVRNGVDRDVVVLSVPRLATILEKKFDRVGSGSSATSSNSSGSSRTPISMFADLWRSGLRQGTKDV